VLPSVGRALECRQIRTALLTVSCTLQRVWVINGSRDYGQFECVVEQLNLASALFSSGFFVDGRVHGVNPAAAWTAVASQITAASGSATAEEKLAMFPSMHSVADWLKQRTDKPKLLVRAPCNVGWCLATDAGGQVLHRCSDAPQWLQLIQVHSCCPPCSMW
jgi:hypothetical protein